jgi:hypothetical protein
LRPERGKGGSSLRSSPRRWEAVSAWDSTSSRAIEGQSAPSRDASSGQSAEIEGLSTTGVVSASSCRAIASHSLAASDSAEDGPAAAMAGTGAMASTASSGRASQTSLHREQRTVRPAVPKVSSLTA